MRMRLITSDGTLLGNRKLTKEYYVNRYGFAETEFIQYAVTTECREKGLKLVKWAFNPRTDEDLVVTVDYF